MDSKVSSTILMSAYTMTGSKVAVLLSSSSAPTTNLYVPTTGAMNVAAMSISHATAEVPRPVLRTDAM